MDVRNAYHGIRRFVKESRDAAYYMAARADAATAGLYDVALTTLGANAFFDPSVGSMGRYVAAIAVLVGIVSPKLTEDKPKAEELRFKRNFLAGIGGAVLLIDSWSGVGLIGASAIMFEKKRREIREGKEDKGEDDQNTP